MIIDNKHYIDNKLHLLNTITKLNQIATGKEQVQRRTLNTRKETIMETFKILNIDEFKYLEDAKTDKQLNKEIQRAAKTLHDKLHRYVKVENQKLKFYDDQTASRGVRVTKYDLNYLEKLQDTYNEEIQRAFKEFKKQNPNLSDDKLEMLMGARGADPNDSSELYLPVTFSPVDFVSEIQPDTDISYYIQETIREMNRFEKEVSHYNNDKFIEQLDNWVEENNLNDDQKDLIIAHFNQLDIIQKYNFNVTLEKRMAWVDSIVSNPRASKNYFEAIVEIVMDQKNIEFTKVSYDLKNTLASEYFENKRKEKNIK